MKVRVAFAVVSRLDEPIILVDEVLAVGDRAFKRKCYARIEELIAEGRTFFLVSHSDADLQRFCTRGIYLKHGRLIHDGPMDEVLAAYAAEDETAA
jgi:ABC-2 type transport system ATP-binding protein